MIKPIMLSLAVALVVTACGSSPTQTRYYTLHPNLDIEPVGNLSGRSIGIGPVVLPESLQSLGVTTGGTQNAVLVASDHQWAGDLKQSISRIVALNVGSLLNNERVWPYPWDARARPEIQVKLVVEQLTGNRGGEVMMQAKWQIFGSQGTELLGVEQTLLRAKTEGNSYNDYVAAINRLINKTSEAVAKSLLKRIGEG